MSKHFKECVNDLQAAVQSLIDKLEPLFPEIAGMSGSSDGLVEAIHGCELRLVHAHEAVLVRAGADVHANKHGLMFVHGTMCKQSSPVQSPHYCGVRRRLRSATCLHSPHEYADVGLCSCLTVLLILDACIHTKLDLP